MVYRNSFVRPVVGYQLSKNPETYSNWILSIKCAVSLIIQGGYPFLYRTRLAGQAAGDGVSVQETRVTYPDSVRPWAIYALEVKSKLLG